jgi:hypothetical protein
MGIQQNTMWQQPPPQSSTNPFAAPSGPSVRDCPLFFFSVNQLLLVYRQVLFRVLCRLHTFVESFFFSLFFLSSRFSNASTFNPLFFFSLSRRCRRTSQQRFIYIRPHFLQIFFFASL